MDDPDRPRLLIDGPIVIVITIGVLVYYRFDLVAILSSLWPFLLYLIGLWVLAGTILFLQRRKEEDSEFRWLLVVQFLCLLCSLAVCALVYFPGVLVVTKVREYPLIVVIPVPLFVLGSALAVWWL